MCNARCFRPSGPYRPSCPASEGIARGASSPAEPALHMPLSLPTTSSADSSPYHVCRNEPTERVRAVYAPLIEICCAAYKLNTTQHNTTTTNPHHHHLTLSSFSPLHSHIFTGFAEVDKNPPIGRNTQKQRLQHSDQNFDKTPIPPNSCLKIRLLDETPCLCIFLAHNKMLLAIS